VADVKDQAAAARRVRLYVEAPLAAGAELPLDSGQTHYLANVMRFKAGDRLAIFNGRDGEWRAVIGEMRRNACTLVAEAQTKPQQAAAGPALLFAPIKPTRTALLIEKACELGAAEFQPVSTQHSQGSRIRLERYRAHAIEAAEQCGRLDVPPIHPLAPLEEILSDWQPPRRLMFCDESGGAPAVDALAAMPPAPWAILVGPEGGFAAAERQRLGSCPFSVAVSLGPRTLRSETAAIAALSLWQATLGDLRDGDSVTIS
jgi:16S rRNA (uracil1498-N3)-methyltransferase